MRVKSLHFTVFIQNDWKDVVLNMSTWLRSPGNTLGKAWLLIDSSREHFDRLNVRGRVSGAALEKGENVETILKNGRKIFWLNLF